MKGKVLHLLVPPTKERLPDRIAAQIKAIILSEDIQEGQRLPSERELADRLQVSRTVVREALRSLEQAGLIEIRAGSRGGSFVTYNLYKPFFNSIYDLFQSGKLTLHHFYEARKAVECFSIKMAVQNVTAKDLQKLRRINKKMLDDLHDKTKFRKNNMDFHVAIAEMTGNPLIKLMVRSLIELLNMVLPKSCQSPEFIRATYERHEEIIKAIGNQDVSLCEKLMAIDTEYTEKLTLESAT